MSAHKGYAKSALWLERARRVTPGGAQTRSKMTQVFVEGAYPAVLAEAKGCRVWDVDGNEYVDFVGGLAAVGIGYNVYPSWDVPTYSLPTVPEIEYAEQLTRALGYDMVRFVKTGSEATEGAMRIARVVTGHQVIVSIGYHGWHSVHDAVNKDAPGVPGGYRAAIRNAPYGDLGHVEALLVQGDVAAVLVEPVLHTVPPEGYLAGLTRLCKSNGALLIFDEVVTGFRWALGGAAEYFGVRPDLACFGKAMANGWPLAAVLGSRELMNQGGRYISGTYCGEVESLRVGRETLHQYLDHDVVGQIWRAGATLQAMFNAAATTTGAPYVMKGYPCKPYVRVTVPDPGRQLVSLLLQELAARGVLFHPVSLCVMAAHTPEVMATLGPIFQDTFTSIWGGTALKGKPSRLMFGVD